MNSRTRNLLIQIGLTSLVVIGAVALVLYIVVNNDDGRVVAGGAKSSDSPVSIEPKAIRVASGDVITMAGNDEPKVVLSLYEDFLCPHCANFERVFGVAVNELIDSGAVAADYYMVAILDRKQNQDYSSRAAAAAYCVADESTEAFRRLHAALYSQQPDEAGTSFPTDDDLIKLAREAGAEGGVADCITSGRYLAMVGELAHSTGVNATPTVRINNEDYEFTTPVALTSKVNAIVGR